MVCCPWDGAPLERNRCAGCDRTLDPEWSTCPWCRTEVAGFAHAVPVPPKSLPRLLVVDDDESVCQFVTAALAGAAVVTTALDSDTALHLLGSQEFDGVLVDNGLPDLTGVEFIRLVRSDPKTLTMPLVLFTGTSSPDVEREARNAGADDFLAKPVEPVILEERVLSLLARETHRRPSAKV
jgi:DNA-binding response OmpR family regulator